MNSRPIKKTGRGIRLPDGSYNAVERDSLGRVRYTLLAFYPHIDKANLRNYLPAKPLPKRTAHIPRHIVEALENRKRPGMHRGTMCRLRPLLLEFYKVSLKGAANGFIPWPLVELLIAKTTKGEGAYGRAQMHRRMQAFPEGISIQPNGVLLVDWWLTLPGRKEALGLLAQQAFPAQLENKDIESRSVDLPANTDTYQTRLALEDRVFKIPKTSPSPLVAGQAFSKAQQERRQAADLPPAMTPDEIDEIEATLLDPPPPTEAPGTAEDPLEALSARMAAEEEAEEPAVGLTSAQLTEAAYREEYGDPSQAPKPVFLQGRAVTSLKRRYPELVKLKYSTVVSLRIPIDVALAAAEGVRKKRGVKANSPGLFINGCRKRLGGEWATPARFGQQLL